MPKAKKKVTAPAGANTAMLAPTPVAETTHPARAAGLPVVYDRVSFEEYSTASQRGPLTPDDARLILGWETEEQYKARMLGEEPGSKPAQWAFGDVYHCLDTEKRKVRCWNNANNRPFDQGWCDDLIHTVLQGQWAGPLTVPGETVNGETVRVSRYGRVISGQHQLTALVLADEILQRSRLVEGDDADPEYPFWVGRDCCVIETFVVTGLSEDERVLRTVDYVKPRNVADMLYTMELFRQNTPPQRKELTRMLAAAADLLWTRTDARGYRTHPEVVGFLERHRRLLKCVEHLFVENAARGADGGRRVSKLRVNPGHAAALCYLMGSSGPGTDGDDYRNECPPSERGLDWAPWERALDFWARLASDRGFMPVRMALGRLVDSTPGSEDNVGLGGRAPEKFAVLAKAWEAWRDHPPGDATPVFDADEDLADGGMLSLSYSDLDDRGNKLPDGQVKLVDVADFGGIDAPGGLAERVGRGRAADPPAPSRAEIEAAAEAARARRAPKADKSMV